ncbi:MAG: glycosyltransferase family 4 protein [Hyphomicrobiaceae bacterium]
MPDKHPLFAKILIAITEDWFALSHFRPLIAKLRQLATEVVVVTNSSGRMAEIEALGVRTIAFDYSRSSMHPLRESVRIVRLARILRAEKPDVAHLIAMKPIVLGGIAAGFARTPCTVLHLTGLGFLAISPTRRARLARSVALTVMRRVMVRSRSWLIVENPEDLDFVQGGGVGPGGGVTVLGGAGIDPDAFPALNTPQLVPPVAAFVGRMIRPKGVDVLMAAADLLKARNVPHAIELYGHSDDGNPEAIPSCVLEDWSDGGRTRWMGHTSDIAGVWRRAGIFVLPARSREGMPRAMLEAASCARPLVVTDVPGCRYFVRDGVEGLIVPPGDAPALADALEKLIRDPALRQKLGNAARTRVLEGYTIAHVEAALEKTYRALASIR